MNTAGHVPVSQLTLGRVAVVGGDGVVTFRWRVIDGISERLLEIENFLARQFVYVLPNQRGLTEWQLK